jgi:hypothetical protein
MHPSNYNIHLNQRVAAVFHVTEFLASQNWSGPCISLLKHMKSLNPDKPAILHIRHTERTSLTQEEILRSPSTYTPGYYLPSTDIGKQAAADFGASLPTDREYTLFHTHMDRTLETAESICQGIRSIGGKALIAGEMADIPVLDQKARNELSQKRVRKYGLDAYPDEGATNWICGLNPPNMVKPSLEFAQEIAWTNMDHLRNAQSNALHMYVSHDTWIHLLMFHWFAVLPDPNNAPFLGGFLMQFDSDDIHVWFRGESKLCEYPYWWPKT